jgi:hypothetical protein
MSARITHTQVDHWLAWARNYGEIIDFQKIANKGRMWMIEVEPGIRTTAMDSPTGRGVGGLIDFGGIDPATVVPEVMVLTTREAFMFGMGCAVAGLNRSRMEIEQEDAWHRPPPDGRCSRWRKARHDEAMSRIWRRRGEYARRTGKQKLLMP